MLDTATDNRDLKSDGNIGLDQNAKYKLENHKQFTNFDDNEYQPGVYGFKKDTFKMALVWTGYLLTLGLLRLFYHWYPHLKLYSSHVRCNLEDADKVLIIDKYKEKYKMHFVEKIRTLTWKNLVTNLGDAKDNGANHKISFSLSNGLKKELLEIRAFWCKKVCHVWDHDTMKFVKLVGLDDNVLKSDLHAFKGYDSYQQSLRQIIYGRNEIDVPLESVFRLFVLEALTPFYIFQVFSLIVWFAEAYYYYTIAIVVMSTYGISSSIIQTRRNQKNLKGTVHLTDKVVVCRGSGIFEDIPTTDLVPGDVIVIPRHGCVMHCDAILLNGNCIVNESMLTGESVPVLKTALAKTETLYKPKEDDLHTLFGGTTIIQSRYYGDEKVLAVVLRTGFLTSKGQLVRSIMYPPPADFKFDQDSYKFIGILALIAAMGFIYTVVSKSSRDLAAGDIALKALDLITIVIPPALPAAMTVGKLYALNRLKKKNIFCINSRIINVSGSINCICFDKTGTLTEDGLDMWGLIPIEGVAFGDPIRDVTTCANDSLLLRGMVTCHTLTLIDGNLTGDPLDVKMFESTGWVLEEPDVADTAKYDLLVPAIVKPAVRAGESSKNFEDATLEIGIVQQFQFSSTLQRMSVITKTLGATHFDVYCKGAPEMIASLSKPESVPSDISERLGEYTGQGYRVIAIATKTLDDANLVKIDKMHRNDVECDLTFVGLVVLENRLKPETTPVIRVLKEAGMKIVMMTGDNMQTAVSVAKECGIVERGATVVDVVVGGPTKSGKPQLEFKTAESYEFIRKNWEGGDVDVEAKNKKVDLAMSGNVWGFVRRHLPEEIPKICSKGVVFARMSSDQKQQLVVELQALGYYVAMCGDGTNDCGALKAAHVGVSLSEAESSVASPFTSKEPNIACVPEVIKEGRAALVTSFGVFKFMLCYSLTEFASVIILYGIDCNLTSQQFLFIDIFLVLSFASIFGLTEAYDKAIVKKAPTATLLGFTPLMSLLFHLLAVVSFQVTSYYIIQSYHWFKPFVYDPSLGNVFKSYENYAVFTVSMFQYITTAIVFSKGNPYRKSLYTNKYLVGSMIVMVAVCAYITLNPAQWILTVLEMLVPPFYEPRLIILVIALVNFLVAFLLEEILVDYFLDRKVKPRCAKLKKNKGYLQVESDLRKSRWPFLKTNGDAEYGVVDEIGVKRIKSKQNGACNEAFEEEDVTKL